MGNKPGDANYVDPDRPQPCQEKRRIPTDKYRKGWDRIFKKKDG